MARYDRRNHPARTNRKRWQALRLKILNKHEWKCAVCDGYANELDHVTPCHKGGEHWAETNLQPICRGCHVQKTAMDKKGPPSREVLEWRAVLETL